MKKQIGRIFSLLTLLGLLHGFAYVQPSHAEEVVQNQQEVQDVEVPQAQQDYYLRCGYESYHPYQHMTLPLSSGCPKTVVRDVYVRTYRGIVIPIRTTFYFIGIEKWPYGA